MLISDVIFRILNYCAYMLSFSCRHFNLSHFCHSFCFVDKNLSVFVVVFVISTKTTNFLSSLVFIIKINLFFVTGHFKFNCHC